MVHGGPMVPTILANDEAAIVMTIVIIAAVIVYIIKSVKDVKLAKEREATKREVAAYVAEGTIRPEDASMILNSGGTGNPAEQQIATGVAWGTINPEKANDLLRTLRTPAKPDGKAASV